MQKDRKDPAHHIETTTVPTTADNASPSAGFGGSNLSHVRAHNERVVLSLIRSEAMPRAEIARRTGLSPQTISLITRSLSQEGLIETCEPVRGKVGQPSVPLRLNPDGAFFLGAKIGRRSVELILINFIGDTLHHRSRHYAWPRPSDIVDFLRREIPALTATLGEPALHRLHGLGIAMPYQLWSWADTIDAPAQELEHWRDFDFQSALGDVTDMPIIIENDATSACGAELTFGQGHQHPHFAYFFIGYFVGGALVLDGSVFVGQSGNAGAFGSLPVPDADTGRLVQLIDTASVYLLENSKECRAALRHEHLKHDSPFWHSGSPAIERWLQKTAESLAMAIVSVSSVADVGGIIIDGVFPAAIRQRLVQATANELDSVNTRGIEVPVVQAGVIGAEARSLGAARLPLFARFLLDQSVLTNAGS